MTLDSAAILERFRQAHGKDIDLTLRHAYESLLGKLGHPEDHLPPTIIVAGTNGKGSTCAFLRAIVEASGRKAHVFTSPHLIRFHERIRIAGELITEDELASLLAEAERVAEPGGVSIFEVGTAVALAAFARHPADVAILEVGLGGRLDATNIVPDPIASIITRLSYDHRDYLGDTMDQIAREKAGILRRRTPCFTAPQPSEEAMLALRDEASRFEAPLCVGGEEWRIEAVDADHFRFVGPTRKIENLPRPALIGTHQLWNAGLAIAALDALPFSVDDEAIREGMRRVAWPGRLHRLIDGPLAAKLPEACELWLDGGHNDSAGEVLAAQLRRWHAQDGKPVDLIYGMLSSKTPEEFLAPMLPFIRRVRTVRVDGEVPGHSAEHLAACLQSMGVQEVEAAPSFSAAFDALISNVSLPSRVLACGSLYLVGHILRVNQKY